MSQMRRDRHPRNRAIRARARIGRPFRWTRRTTSPGAAPTAATAPQSAQAVSGPTPAPLLWNEGRASKSSPERSPAPAWNHARRACLHDPQHGRELVAAAVGGIFRKCYREDCSRANRGPRRESSRRAGNDFRIAVLDFMAISADDRRIRKVIVGEIQCSRGARFRVRGRQHRQLCRMPSGARVAARALTRQSRNRVFTEPLQRKNAAETIGKRSRHFGRQKLLEGLPVPAHLES